MQNAARNQAVARRETLAIDAAPRFARIPPGPHDRHPALMRIAAMAAFFEQRGVEVLKRKAAEASTPALREALGRHAAEEREHVAALCALTETGRLERPPFLLRLVEREFRRRRPLVRQSIGTLVIESLGIAVYSAVAERIGPGRASEVLLSIADDERVHLDRTAEMLAGLLSDASSAELRRLRRLRAFLVAAVVTGHALGHAAILGPLVGRSAAPLRQRILAETRRSFAALPALA
jgi:rubrerythrin